MSETIKSQEEGSSDLKEDVPKIRPSLPDPSLIAASRLPNVPTPEPEAIVSPARRRLTAHYKLDILKEIDHCDSVDHVGALLRREGLYASQICRWRKARKSGALDALSKRRGRPIKKSAQEKQIEELKAETKRLQAKLEEAGAIIDIQKKVSEIFGNKIRKD